MKKIESLYNNGIFEFLNIEEDFTIDDKVKTIKRKLVRRPPGIRAIIINEGNKILLSKEFRYELNSFDYRLPGGKVFDTIEDYQESLNNNTLAENVFKTVSKEVLEEVGLIIHNPTLIKVSHDGASVEWDLYYFEIKDYEVSSDGNHLEENEFVCGYDFYSFDEIIKMCQENKIHEDRSIAVLLTYILKKDKN